MFIIAGTKGVTSTIANGIFYCPNCAAKTKYRHQQVHKTGTVFFIPVAKLKLLEEYIECQRCQSAFELRVLNYDPEEEGRVLLSEYYRAMKRVLITMMLADGKVDNNELEFIKHIYTNVIGQRYSEDEIKQEIYECERSPELLYKYLNAVSSRLNESYKVHIIRIAYFVAYVDGDYSKNEEVVLKQISKGLGMTSAYLDRIIDKFNEELEKTRKEKTEAVINYYNLKDWWFSEFTDSERKNIQKKIDPVDPTDDALTEGENTYKNITPLCFLRGLAGCFVKDKDRHLAYKILKKAEDFVDDDSRALDVHFLYGEKINMYYRDREKPGGLRKSIEACKQQIAYSPKAAKAFRKEYEDSLPSHRGYGQLAIILEKHQKYQLAIELCKRAEKQGWAGDWEKRIQRCAKKANKLEKLKVAEKQKTKQVHVKGVKEAVPKKAEPATAVDTVLAIINSSKKGIGTTALMEKTGYNQKKISNLVYKLGKQGKIKSVSKGVYVKA